MPFEYRQEPQQGQRRLDQKKGVFLHLRAAHHGQRASVYVCHIVIASVAYGGISSTLLSSKEARLCGDVTTYTTASHTLSLCIAASALSCRQHLFSVHVDANGPQSMFCSRGHLTGTQPIVARTRPGGYDQMPFHTK